MSGAVQRTARASAWALSASVAAAASGGLAGEATPPSEPPASTQVGRCGVLGEGYFAVPGSDACIRISGYVAADTEFNALRPASRPAGPFANPPSAAATRASAGVSFDERFDTPMGPGRVYVEIAHDRFAR